MTSNFEKRLFEEMQKCWDDVDENYSDMPRGYFKNGFISGGRWAYQQGIKDAIEAVRSDSKRGDDMARILADWLEERFGVKK